MIPELKIIFLNEILPPELKIPLFVSLLKYNVLRVSCNHSLGGFGFLDKQVKNSQLNKVSYLAGN